MRNLLKKVYENIVYYEEDSLAIGKELDEKINIYIQKYSNKLTQNELEELKGIFYKNSLDAEEKGFYLGVKYTMKLFFDTVLK